MNASQLARVARISVPSAARMVAALKAEGYLDPARRGLVLLRLDELLQRWRSATPRRTLELAARWVLPATHPRGQLSAAVAAYVRRSAIPDGDLPFHLEEPSAVRAPRACLGLYAACEQLGLPFSHGSPLHLYLEEVTPEALQALGLVRAARGEAAHVVVRVPRCPEALFRGNVIRGGAPVADALQCWLDTVDHPARGAEQAAALWKQVLAPGFFGVT